MALSTLYASKYIIISKASILGNHSAVHDALYGVLTIPSPSLLAACYIGSAPSGCISLVMYRGISLTEQALRFSKRL